MADLQMARTQLYAFTYKKNVPVGTKANKLDYVLVLRDLEDKLSLSIHSVYYELDSTDNWHIHGMFYGPKNLIYKTCTFKGYTSRIKKVYDYAGWECYCKKDQDDDSIDTPENLILKHSLFKQI